jgi:hypothetical protein
MFTANNKALFGCCAAEPSKFGVRPHDLADRQDRWRFIRAVAASAAASTSVLITIRCSGLVALPTMATSSAGSRPGSINRCAIRARLPSVMYSTVRAREHIIN